MFNSPAHQAQIVICYLAISRPPFRLALGAICLTRSSLASSMSRLHSLEKSNQNFPLSLVLVEKSRDNVIGHSRLCKILEDKKACWVESVVIRKDRRRQGLGKLLMLYTEEFARKLGYKIVYLNTEDKQDFYQHIGYSYCDPVCAISGTCCPFPQRLQEAFQRQHKVSPLEIEIEKELKSTTILPNDNFAIEQKTTDLIATQILPPPPPPPPVPPIHNSRNFKNYYWMKKIL